MARVPMPLCLVRHALRAATRGKGVRYPLGGGCRVPKILKVPQKTKEKEKNQNKRQKEKQNPKRHTSGMARVAMPLCLVRQALCATA